MISTANNWKVKERKSVLIALDLRNNWSRSSKIKCIFLENFPFRNYNYMIDSLVLFATINTSFSESSFTFFKFLSKCGIKPLSVNLTKWSNTLKQFVIEQPMNFLSVFDHFMRLALKRLKWLITEAKFEIQNLLKLTWMETFFISVKNTTLFLLFHDVMKQNPLSLLL